MSEGRVKDKNNDVVLFQNDKDFTQQLYIEVIFSTNTPRVS